MQKDAGNSNESRPPPRGRGRPRAFDRDEALDRATRLFWEKGYEATSIADLTAAMGIGSPSLYAAFGSKENLYAESLRHYRERNEAIVWGRFFTADTAREAVNAYLTDSAAALGGCIPDMPRGCMVTLSAVGSEGHSDLGDLVRANRHAGFERLLMRLRQGVNDGDIPPGTDLNALARFVQTVQSGMSILGRDGAGRSDLEAVAALAMLGWDARTGARPVNAG
ncbi:TetR/AcrR family transcriptional regulator [Sphingomonas sp.]|uniref:TetR/AcrR family transcriptional regulator n=1 Tax=Sphingomonas sp. TaxID=28214 RepID=UPI002C66895E|nr:TetR/AcrR family transcriptional regulator [Sphingomonas sp.]HTG38710.1 TetR/AcrR family transcriptional regulator [Sphingomonas sp.]